MLKARWGVEGEQTIHITLVRRVVTSRVWRDLDEKINMRDNPLVRIREDHGRT